MGLTTDPNDNPAVLQLGDPRLRRVSRPAVRGSEELRIASVQLLSVLAAFRAEYGFGRAIAAPQLGFDLRCLACWLDAGPMASEQPFIILNPRITWRSTETFTLWDDCMSFPHLLVKVHRYRSISVAYSTALGLEVTHDALDPATAELLQHEIDHLDGILAVDHALGRDALVSRAGFESNRSHFDAQVDAKYMPTPSVKRAS